jgi:Rieske Fe-S protein
MSKRKRKKKKGSKSAPVETPSDPVGPEEEAREEKADATAPEQAPAQAPEPKEHEAISRRDFLSGAGRVAVGACAAGALVGSVRMTVPDFFDGPPERFALGKPADFKSGTLTWVRDKELFVLRADEGFGVFSSRCTHLGCTVRRTADGFFCPCHGARYDPEGRVTHGPARRALPWYHIWADQDGSIWVDTGREVNPGELMHIGGAEPAP